MTCKDLFLAKSWVEALSAQGLRKIACKHAEGAGVVDKMAGEATRRAGRRMTEGRLSDQALLKPVTMGLHYSSAGPTLAVQKYSWPLCPGPHPSLQDAMGL